MSERRGLVPFEVAAVLAIAAIPWPEALPLGIPLVFAGSISMWARGRSWAEGWKGGGYQAGVGAVVGLVALALAVVFGIGGQFPMVRGGGSQTLMVVTLVAINALAMELALRGWIVERVLELSPGPAVLPVLCGAIAEAMITPGAATARIGAGLFGAGLGWMYVAGGRSVTAPVLARVAFASGAVMLEGLKVIG